VCEIDTLLMSCRVLGRGVEDAFLHAMAKAAAEEGAMTLAAPFVEGPRNQLCKEFLKRSGFQEAPENVWQLGIEQLPALPGHILWQGREQVSPATSGT
jgi:predicted enzyme involved in methoxymalonyl-ACP biosynthesis